MCAAMALRGLTHNEANHPALLEAGAPEVLMAVMRANGNPPAQRINAAMAVALLVGHEESSAVLMELGEVAGFMLDALRCACMGTQFQGLHWTAWWVQGAGVVSDAGLSRVPVCSSFVFTALFGL